MTAKPTIEELGIDPDAQDWQRSGEGDGAIEIAFVRAGAGAGAGAVAGRAGAGGTGKTRGTSGAGAVRLRAGQESAGDWVLMRVTDDPDRRVLVFDRNEWECFLDGARKGEFDDAAGNAGNAAP